MDSSMIAKELKGQGKDISDQGKKAKIKMLQHGKTPGNSTAC